jgi:acetate CoA/acetoacetate CoA-transferase alpha subunit
MEKIIDMEQAIAYVEDGMTIMIGGFLGNGVPDQLIEAVLQKGVKNLTLICNDTGFPDRGIGKLVVNKQVKKVMTSHIGTNPESGKQMHSGEMDVRLIPQGTLVEQIRSAGAGLGGFLTPTGIGTVVEEGKKVVEIDGKDYLLELPIKADLALIRGSRVDKKGNVWYRNSTRNFNPIMAMAADRVIVETDEVVEIGEIDPNNVATPHIFVDHIVRRTV